MEDQIINKVRLFNGESFFTWDRIIPISVLNFFFYVRLFSTVIPVYITTVSISLRSKVSFWFHKKSVTYRIPMRYWFSITSRRRVGSHFWTWISLLTIVLNRPSFVSTLVNRQKKGVYNFTILFLICHRRN